MFGDECCAEWYGPLRDPHSFPTRAKGTAPSKSSLTAPIRKRAMRKEATIPPKPALPLLLYQAASRVSFCSLPHWLCAFIQTKYPRVTPTS